MRKNDRYIWIEWIYALLLHPLSKRRKALQLTFWQKRRKNSDVFLSFCLNSNQECGSRKEIWKKNFRNIWRLCDNVLTFAPAFRKECNRRLTCWLRNRFAKNSFLFFFYLPFAKRDDEKKKKEKKTSEIIWSICLKVLTFASAFWKENQFKKEAIFEEFT